MMTIKSMFFLFVIIVCLVLLASYAFTGSFEIWKIATLGLKSGYLQISGAPPTILAVFVNQTPTADPITLLPSGYASFSPVADFNTTLIFNATVYDVNGGCDKNVTFYICQNETLWSNCNPTNAYATVADTFGAGDTKYDCNPYGQGNCKNCCCNFTAQWTQFPYFKKCGMWYVNATACNTGDKCNTTVKGWKDKITYYAFYPRVGPKDEGAATIVLGFLNASAWNNGTGVNTTKNGGNVNITLYWNATNFTNTLDFTNQIPMDLCSHVGCTGLNSTFAVDNDTINDVYSGWINETNTTRIQYPSYGLYRCEDYDCKSKYANYSLYWHLYVPGGKAGIYTNSIELYSNTSMTCD
jgi:hypothetical protein